MKEESTYYLFPLLKVGCDPLCCPYPWEKLLVHSSSNPLVSCNL